MGPTLPAQGGSITFSTPVAAMQALVGGGIGGVGGNADAAFSAGKGGSGGGVVANAQAVLSNVGGSITTSGYAAAGMLAQNIGGHGGNGAFGGGVFVAKGGKGQPGGTPGFVYVTGSGGSITTTGDSSSAMVAQSIGGGGGYGGDAHVEGVILGVAVGGDSANGGDGQTATIYNGIPNNDFSQFTNGLIVSTAGYKSSGLVAQSIGGGGGIAGDARVFVPAGYSGVSVGGNGAPAVTAPRCSWPTAALFRPRAMAHRHRRAEHRRRRRQRRSCQQSGGRIAIHRAAAAGGTGGKGGDANEVDVANQLQVVTGGTDSYALVGQSIGGGGGHAGTSVSRNIQLFNDPEFLSAQFNVSVGGNGGQGGSGGVVNVSNSGVAMTTNAGSTAVFAQSIAAAAAMAAIPARSVWRSSLPI